MLTILSLTMGADYYLSDLKRKIRTERNMKIRKVKRNQLGQMNMVGAAMGIFITLIVAVLIYFNVASSIDVAGIDAI